jgi:hypothetical protein
MELLSRSQLLKNALRSRRWAPCQLSRFQILHLHWLGTWHPLQSPCPESLSSPRSPASSQCNSHSRSPITAPLFTSRFPVKIIQRPLLWLLLVREVTPEVEVAPEAELHDMLHLLTPEVVEVEMHPAGSLLRVWTPRPLHPVQTPLDVVRGEVGEGMDRTGTATFLHLSTPN